MISADGGVGKMTRPSKNENATLPNAPDARHLHPHLSRPDVSIGQARTRKRHNAWDGCMACKRVCTSAAGSPNLPLLPAFRGSCAKKKRMESRAGSGVLSNEEANENVRQICTCASAGDGSEIVKGLTAG